MSCRDFTHSPDKKKIKSLCVMITFKYLMYMYLLGYKTNNIKMVCLFSEKHYMNSIFKRCLSMSEFSTNSKCLLNDKLAG